MTYQITAYDVNGRRIANLGTRGTIEGARQAMLDHSNTIELPAEEPSFLPDIGVVEAWFVGRTEYLIGTPGAL